MSARRRMVASLVVVPARAEPPERRAAARATSDRPSPSRAAPRVQDPGRRRASTTSSSCGAERGGHACHPFAKLACRAALAGPRSRKIARTSVGAATNSTMSAWSTCTSSIGVPGGTASRCRRRAARRTAGRPARRPGFGPAEQRDRDARRSRCWPRRRRSACPLVPSTCDAAEPASAPARTIADDVACAPTLMPAVRAASGLAPTARSSKPNVQRSSSQPDAHRGQQRQDEAQRGRGSAAPSSGGSAALVVHGLADRVVAAPGRLKPVLQQERQEVERDVVEHDRGDHLVRAGPGLEDTRDEAPQRAADAPRDERERAGAGRGQVEREARRTRRRCAPMMTWPWAPMLNRPARNASADRQAGEDQRASRR